jgi:hypothetical protein
MSSRSRPVTKVLTSSSLIFSEIFFFLAAGENEFVELGRVARVFDEFNREPDAFVGFLRRRFEEFVELVAFAEKLLE